MQKTLHNLTAEARVEATVVVMVEKEAPAVGLEV